MDSQQIQQCWQKIRGIEHLVHFHGLHSRCPDETGRTLQQQFLLDAGQFQKGRFIFITIGIVVGYRHDDGIFQFAMALQFFQESCEHVIYQFCF